MRTEVKKAVSMSHINWNDTFYMCSVTVLEGGVAEHHSFCWKVHNKRMKNEESWK